MGSHLLLTALTVVLGAQLVEVLLPALTWYLAATHSLSAAQVAAAAYAPVGLAWLAPPAAQRLGLGRALWVLGAGLLVCRLAEQFSTTMAADAWLALAGTACFMGLLPLLYARTCARGEAGPPAFALGLLLGLSTHTALRGLTGTLNLSWIAGAWPRLVVAGLVAAFALALWRVGARPAGLPADRARSHLPLLGLGPALFVEWQIFQNQGWVAVLTGWPSTAALVWITLANLLALAAAARVLAHAWPRPAAIAGLSGAALVAALLAAQTPGWVFALSLLVGSVAVGVLVAVIVAAHDPPGGAAGPAALSLGFGLAMLVWMTLTTLYYLSLLLPLLPFPRSLLAPVAGAALATCAVAAAWRPGRWPAPRPGWAGFGLALLVALVPLIAWAAQAPAARPPAEPSGASIRVMTYNIRSGYGLDGRLDVEAIAQTIEGARPQVVALQELSRGWLITGSADLLSLLSRRLAMPGFVMGPTIDPLFGNGLLSRYPLPAGGHAGLPGLDALVVRGYVWARLDWAAGEPLFIVGTHLDSDRSDVRLVQLAALLDEWAGRPQTVLLGDMNARPGSPEIEMILAAGFVDAWAEAGRPEHPRIDWIFHTPDLVARDVVMIESSASDHPAYAATLALRP
jgi:endonuclease/exonuclease/phosphatase family metal-dependent hydrolase